MGPGRGEPFTRTPEELTKNANYLQANIEAALPKGNLEIDDYPTKAKSHGTIDGERYVSKVVFDPPLFERRPVRGNPQVYPVEQLRGKGEIAALLVVSAPPRSAASAKTTTPAPARSTAPAKGMAETDITDGNLMGRRAVTAAGHPEGRHGCRWSDSFRFASKGMPIADISRCARL